MPDPTAYRCTLDPSEIPARTQQTRRLAGHLVDAERGDGEVVLRFDSSASDDVRAFVEAESRCCSFFGFTTTRTGPEVRLRVTAPAAAQPMLDALTAVFEQDGPSGPPAAQ